MKREMSLSLKGENATVRELFDMLAEAWRSGVPEIAEFNVRDSNHNPYGGRTSQRVVSYCFYWDLEK